MARKAIPVPRSATLATARTPAARARPSVLLDTRVIYCGDCLEQLQKLPDVCVDLITIDPPASPGCATSREAIMCGLRPRRVSRVNSNRNCEVFWGEAREKRAFEDRHASTQAYIEFMRPRYVELARGLKKTGSFYYHCDWHTSHPYYPPFASSTLFLGGRTS